MRINVCIFFEDRELFHGLAAKIVWSVRCVASTFDLECGHCLGIRSSLLIGTDLVIFHWYSIGC